MPYKLITQDASIRLSISTLAAAGQAPIYGTALTLTGNAGLGSEVGVDETLETVSVPGIGDTRDKKRAKRGSSTLRIKKYVADAGAVAGLTGTSKLGFYGKVEIKELSSMGAYVSYEGLIVKWSWSGGDQEQIEEIAIDCDAEHA